jgi:hypothetical protein
LTADILFDQLIEREYIMRRPTRRVHFYEGLQLSLQKSAAPLHPTSDISPLLCH